MSTDVLITYEALFKQAQADLRQAGLCGYEKTSVYNPKSFLSLLAERVGGGARGIVELPGAVRAGLRSDAPSTSLGDIANRARLERELAGAGDIPGMGPNPPTQWENYVDVEADAARRADAPISTGKTTSDKGEGPAPRVDEDADKADIPDGIAPDEGRSWRGSLARTGAVGTGLSALGGGGYMLGRTSAEEEADRRRNLAFGAGMATGVAAPRVLQGVGGRLQQLGTQMGEAQGYGPAPGAYGGYY